MSATSNNQSITHNRSASTINKQREPPRDSLALHAHTHTHTYKSQPTVINHHTQHQHQHQHQQSSHVDNDVLHNNNNLHVTIQQDISTIEQQLQHYATIKQQYIQHSK